MSGGATITYNDARRFGYMTLMPEAELAAASAFPGARRGAARRRAERRSIWRAKAFGKKVDLKAFLMDQRIVAGLGNIYVCEALWRAHLESRTGRRTASRRAAASRSRPPSAW